MYRLPLGDDFHPLKIPGIPQIQTDSNKNDTNQESQMPTNALETTLLKVTPCQVPFRSRGREATGSANPAPQRAVPCRTVTGSTGAAWRLAELLRASDDGPCGVGAGPSPPTRVPQCRCSHFPRPRRRRCALRCCAASHRFCGSFCHGPPTLYRIADAGVGQPFRMRAGSARGGQRKSARGGGMRGIDEPGW
jgi:hypothetical protein